MKEQLIPPVGKCEHGISMEKDCKYCERYLIGIDTQRVTGTDCIKDLQSKRGSVYGKFEEQAKCVGKIISALVDCCKENGKEPTDQQVGAFAYQAIKQARYAVSPTHADTLVDLESYCNLIKKMEVGE